MEKRALFKQWLSSGAASLHPLTFPQRELWEASPIPVADVSHHICCLIVLRGLVSRGAWDMASQMVMARHEVLRLSILPGREQPVQLVRQVFPPNTSFRELSASECSDEAIDAIATEEFNKPFDLLQGPLYRLQLMRRSSDEYLAALTIHHAIADGWSLGVFVKELCADYAQSVLGAGAPLPPPALSYTAWGAAERAAWTPAKLEHCATFWRAKLEGRPRLWDTPSGQVERWITQIPLETADAARELARVSGATLFSTLLAVFQIALARWTGQPDTVVGSPVANRASQAAREIIGYCANTVPLRTRVDPDRVFADALRETHDTTVECFANAMPFAELVRAVGDPAYEVRFAMQNHPMPDVVLHGFSAKLKMRSSGTARFQIGCEIFVVPGGLEVLWMFRSALIPKSEVETLECLFTTLLEAACRSPQSRIASLP